MRRPYTVGARVQVYGPALWAVGSSRRGVASVYGGLYIRLFCVVKGAMRLLRGRRWIAIGAGSLVALVLAAAAAGYAYDRSQADAIAKGIRVGSIGIGGSSCATGEALRPRAAQLTPTLI